MQVKDRKNPVETDFRAVHAESSAPQDKPQKISAPLGTGSLPRLIFGSR